MPVHPHCGQALMVVFAKKDRHGRRWVVVEDPRGNRLELPAAWTDLLPAMALVTQDGRAAKFTVEGLRQMTLSVNRAQEVDNKLAVDPPPAMLGAAECAEAGGEEPARQQDLDGVARGSATRPAGRLGAAGPSHAGKDGDSGRGNDGGKP